MKIIESAAFKVLYKSPKGNINFQITGMIENTPFLINGLYEKKRETSSIKLSFHSSYSKARLYIKELTTYLLVSYRKTRLRAVLSGMKLLETNFEIVH